MGAVALTALATLAARRTGLLSPVLLVVAGLVDALLPGPNVTLDPEIILGLVLPPLLYSAALTASLLDMRANVATIALLSVALVLITALVVGVVAAAVVPGLPLAAGVALGAVLATRAVWMTTAAVSWSASWTTRRACSADGERVPRQP